MRSTILDLDKAYELRFDTMALLRLEREFKKPIVEALKEVQSAGTGLSIDGLFTFLRCSNGELSEKSVEELCHLVDTCAPGETTIEKFHYTMNTVVAELNHSLNVDQKKMEELQQASKKAAAGLMQKANSSAGSDTKSSPTQ